MNKNQQAKEHLHREHMPVRKQLAWLINISSLLLQQTQLNKDMI